MQGLKNLRKSQQSRLLRNISEILQYSQPQMEPGLPGGQNEQPIINPDPSILGFVATVQHMDIDVH